MRILIVGAKGMLGTDLAEEFARPAEGSPAHEVAGVDLPEVDITNPSSVRSLLLRRSDDLVVNCAAFTNVDRAESESDQAFAVNAGGVANLARECSIRRIPLVHLSTDYVFDGRKGSPYLEDDPPAPLGVYGRSKLEGEKRLKAEMDPADYLLIRTQWLYGRNGPNFVATILRLAAERPELAVVDDQIGRPTWTVSLARAIRALVEGARRGTYHVANSGEVSWRGFAVAILAKAGLKAVRVRPIRTEELTRPAPRPLNSVLNLERFERDSSALPHWRLALEGYLRQIGRLQEERKT